MISKKEVIKISELARLKLSEEEVSKMQKDLSEVLDYFNLLKKAESKEGLAELIKKEKIMRKDNANPQPESVVKKLIAAAPDKKGDHIKVKAIF
ncbi:Asp-tRNA(Asn)/Glu-tRNA(Gln) amidotransferase subunit GatC [Patescibacteria group bacterium]|nr:Asp-tRNA(Asn)/Glu-tRNA(Gln) amidotransferase subunit GatC [Patescibacteria group bacterium]MBU4367363.1 Asp-tRNA(Asn)/Glu-tRNA(Gln) amidotransferase subunit GatC [Patescibacteria group bacterium]MBU4461982.1 Asp-tRNA(Asn)/Glu-tRNA(Gln) amidotransferase subunit GatC [Patescibacteria group bacterium]MCG2699663.1 Asp-tRNA(Asn)/Glu-tRNA(Gln) amidotransferase subunit GatC [Candidatus Parcubacteria bacterium]